MSSAPHARGGASGPDGSGHTQAGDAEPGATGAPDDRAPTGTGARDRADQAARTRPIRSLARRDPDRPLPPSPARAAREARAARDAAAAEDLAASRPTRRLALLVAVAVTVLALDVVTKVVMVATLADGQRIPLVGDWLSFVLVRNSGAAFSLATGMTWVLTLVALVVVAGIVRYARRLRSTGWAVALGLVLGGAVGNLADRFFRGPGPLQGHVVDFVSVGWWPVFNVADSSICVGGAVLVLLAVLGRDIDGPGARRRTDPQAARR